MFQTHNLLSESLNHYHRLRGQGKYNPNVQIPLGDFDIINNTVAFPSPASKYNDGNTIARYKPGGSVYYPCNTIFDLKGLWALDSIQIFDNGGGATITVKSGLNVFTGGLTTDATMVMDQNSVRTIQLNGKQARFGTVTIETVNGEGPAEVRFFGKLLTPDVLPPLVERPYRGFLELLGFNGNIFNPISTFPWPCMFRHYDFNEKMLGTKSDGSLAVKLNPGYVQGVNYDDVYKNYKDNNREILALLFQSPSAVYKEGYISGHFRATFTGTNGTLLSAYTPENGPVFVNQNSSIWEIQNNKLTTKTPTPTGNLWLTRFDTAHNDTLLTVQVNRTNLSDVALIYCKFTDINNHVVLKLGDGTGNACSVYNVVGGASTLIANLTTTSTDADGVTTDSNEHATNVDVIFRSYPNGFEISIGGKYVGYHDYPTPHTSNYAAIGVISTTAGSVVFDSVKAGETWDSVVKNVKYGSDPKLPASYIEIGKLEFERARRWGSRVDSNSSPLLDTTFSGSSFSTNVDKSGLGYLKYFESGNEDDRFWEGDARKRYTPEEYFARLTCVYDGDEGRLGPGVGIKTADPNAKVVCCALADFGIDYILTLIQIAKEKRTDGRIPCDAFNVHDYLNTAGGQHVPNTIGVAPEQFRHPRFRSTGIKAVMREMTDLIKRKCPGVEFWWTEFGYDTGPSDCGVPILTQAQAGAAPFPQGSYDLQGSLLLRTFFECMSDTSVDRMIVFEVFNEINFDELDDQYKDVPTNRSPYYDPYYGKIQFNSSGITLGEFSWIKCLPSTGTVDITTLVGTQLTLTMPFNTVEKSQLLQVGSSLRLRYIYEPQGSLTYKYQDNYVDGTIVSWTNTQLVVNVTAYHLSQYGSTYVVTNFPHFRLDAPFARKHSWYMIHHAQRILGKDCRFIRDDSVYNAGANNYTHYVVSNNTSIEAHLVCLPTTTGNQITRTINVGHPTAYQADLKSINLVSGTDTALTVTSNSVTVNINERPSIIYCPISGGGGGTNLPPTIIPPADQNITSTTTTLADGGSYDPEGSILTYAYTKQSGPSVTMAGANTSVLSLSALQVGVYVFRLTVTDNLGASAFRDITVTRSAGNQPPTVSPLGSVNTSQSVVDLFATATPQSGATITSYAWTQVAGTTSCVLTNASTSHVTISNLLNGAYKFRVTVTDSNGLSSIQDCPVTVSGVSTNVAPTANAGADKTVTSSTTTLLGSGADSDGSIASYAWTQISGTTATLTNANTASLGVGNLVNGTYGFRLTVTDDAGATGFDDIVITVAIPTSAVAPTAAFLGTINATSSTIDCYDNGSHDNNPGGSITAYAWSQVSGGSCTITNANTNHCTITGLSNGNYVFRETVTNNAGLTATADVTVNITGVSGSANTPPVVTVESSKTVGTSTTTITSTSTDSDGTIVSKIWTKQSGGLATLTNSGTNTLSLSGLVNGVYVFRFTATDNNSASSFAEMTLTVAGVPNTGLTASVWDQVVVTSHMNGSANPTQTLVRLPIGYGNGTSFPIIVFCHGQGEKYNGSQTLTQNFNKMKSTALPYYLNNGLEIPAIVICPMIGFASFDSVDGTNQFPGVFTNELAQYGIDNYGGDPQRCYLTGLSMGGATIFPSLINFPTRWAAALPINCNPQYSGLLGPVRAVVWFYSTQNDTESSPDTVVDSTTGLNNFGHIPFPCWYTIHANLGHTGWNETYSNTWGSTSLMVASNVPNNHPHGEVFYNWMLKFKLSGGVVSLA
jgi:hypothetical protein